MDPGQGPPMLLLTKYVECSDPATLPYPKDLIQLSLDLKMEACV